MIAILRPLFTKIKEVLDEEIEGSGYRSYLDTPDYDKYLRITLRLGNSGHTHNFYFYDELTEEYLLKASREFAQRVVSDHNQGN